MWPCEAVMHASTETAQVLRLDGGSCRSTMTPTVSRSDQLIYVFAWMLFGMSCGHFRTGGQGYSLVVL
jgi:hypothetical protein